MNPEVNILESFDYDNLEVEDCQYILRALEKRAFEHVVCALRAQGPLSEYKEIILDHLKSLLFISDDEFLLRLRLYANDPILSKISEKLNPSYDDSSEWLSSGYDVMMLEFPKTVHLNFTSDKSSYSIADLMRKQMAQHNSSLEEERQSLLKLIQLKKKPYVPEKLRRLLQDSEHDYHGRIDVLKEKSTAKTARRSVGRPPRRFENNVSTKGESETMKTSKVLLKAQHLKNTAGDKSTILNSESPLLNATAVVKGQETDAFASADREISGGENTPSTSKVTKTALPIAKPPTVKTSKFALILNHAPKEGSAVSVTDTQPPARLSVSQPAVSSVDISSTYKLGTSSAAGLSMNANVPPDKPPITNGNAIQKPVVKTEDLDTHKTIDEFSIHYSGGANVVVVDPEDQNTAKESKVRKRRSKLIDDVTCTCARVHPFIFDPAVGDLPKPPRGNPDKRCSKLKASKRAQSNNNDLNNFNYIPQQSLTSGYYPQKNVSYYNSASTSGEIHPLKRSRATSISDDSNLMFQKPIHHPRVLGTPLNVLTTPSYSSMPRSTFYSSAVPQSSAISPVVMSSSVPAGMGGSFTPAPNDYDIPYINDHYYASNAPTRIIPPSQVVESGLSADSGEVEMIMPVYASSRAEMGMEETYDTPKTSYRRHAINTDTGQVSAKSLISSSPATLLSTKPSLIQQSNESVGSVTQSMVHSQQILCTGTTAPVALTSEKSLKPSIYVASNGDGQVTSSGLDFLASTASLLVPMQTQVVESQLQEQQRSNFFVSIPEQQKASVFTMSCDGSSSSYVGVVSAGSSQPQQIIYVQNPASTTCVQEVGAKQHYEQPSTTVYYAPDASSNTATSQAIASATAPIVTNSENLIFSGRSLTPVTWTSQPTVATTFVATNQAEGSDYSSSTTFKSLSTSTDTQLTSTSFPSSSASQVKSQFADNEAAQNFLKQHASLVDTNGLPLNEELTLGSIIRSSNLRNKLFSTASKSSASPSPIANSSSAITTTTATTGSSVSTASSTTFPVPQSQLATTTFSVSVPVEAIDATSLVVNTHESMSSNMCYDVTQRSQNVRIASPAHQSQTAVTSTPAATTNRPN